MLRPVKPALNLKKCFIGHYLDYFGHNRPKYGSVQKSDRIFPIYSSALAIEVFGKNVLIENSNPSFEILLQMMMTLKTANAAMDYAISSEIKVLLRTPETKKQNERTNAFM